ncbi:KaiC domain-containing protein [Haloarchaeobius iranensis]|uniref:KaiC domain protein, AF_0351 family n=1 Tax=Haloarchaeobius iranensis TaxID=996166 RepID=A0A1G9ZZ45_9EURY|nr:KaiC domain-containing protein [Haloarchaeobius iranensis]SDN26191.1 KaiC domain protein, AF_0351 family [Haloarchaeobius iranensis]
MSDDDELDWFERAVQERRGQQPSDDTDDAHADEPDNGDTDEQEAATAEDGSAPADTPDDPTATDAWEALETAEVADPEPDDATGNDSDDSDDDPEPDDPTRSDDGDDGTDGGGLFDDDFGAAMGDIQLPDSAGDPDDGMGGSGMGGSGMGGGMDADIGEMDGNVGDFDPGEFDMGDGGGQFGMGGGGGLGGTSFDDDEFESDMPRIDLGIKGLDEMIQGGVPERSLMVTIGSAGTGKTTFGLQFLNEALENGERAIFITLEESSERVVNSAVEKGMPFDEYVEDDRLAVVDIDPIEMANSLASIRSDLPRLIEQFGATRLVLDSVSLLEMMYDSRAKRRTEVYDFTQSLKDSGITTMLTSEASEDSPFVSRHGIVEYLTDAVFILQYVRPSDFRETRLAVEIQKIRDANHSRETKPYEITDNGISVHRQANIF